MGTIGKSRLGGSEKMTADRKALTNLLARYCGQELPYPNLSLYDLSFELQAFIGKHIFEALEERDRRGLRVSDDEVYLFILDLFGIQCPHPPHRRKWLGPELFECEICKSWIYKEVDSES